MGIKTSTSMAFSTTTIVLSSLLACSQFVIQGVLAQDPITTQTPTTPSTDCPFNPCFNGGLCVKKGDYFDHCECPYGFAGTVCDKQVSTTTSPPSTTTLPRCSSTFHVCFNGGECRIQGSGYVCLCPAGYTGLVCEDVVTSPAPTTTAPATTTAATPSPTAPPTQGVTYPDPTGICSNNPCLNGGTCRPSARGTPGFECVCPSGFGGSFCLNIVSGDSSTTPATTAAPTSQPSNQDLLKDCPNAARNQCFVGGRCHIEGSHFAPHLRCLCADDDGNHHTHSATTSC